MPMSCFPSLLPESIVLCELLPLSQKVPQTRCGPSHGPHMPQPNLPHPLKAPHTGQQKHQVSSAPLAHGGSASFPVLLQTSTPSFWWIRSSLWHTFKVFLVMACLCPLWGRFRFGNNKCLLEPSLENDLGGDAEKYCSIVEMENTIHLIFPSGPFSSGPQVSGTRIVTPNKISHVYQNLHTPYTEQSVAPLNGEQLHPLIWFVPLFGPSSEQRFIMQSFLHCEFSRGHSCFCCQLLFGIQKTIPNCTSASLIEPKPFWGLPFFPSALHRITLPLSGFDPKVRTGLFFNAVPVIQ